MTNHPHPITVEVTVPTPEALHELSIFLQEFTRKHHRQPAHHASFAAETGQAPTLHQQSQFQAPSVHGGQNPQAHSQLLNQQLLDQQRLMQAQPAIQQPAISFQDLVALQNYLMTNRVIDAPGLVGIYQKLGIDLAAGGVPPEKYGALHAELSALKR